MTEIWKTQIEPQIAGTTAVISENVKVVADSVNARLQSNQVGLREVVSNTMDETGSAIALASSELESLVKIIDIGLRFSKPLTRNKDNAADELIYGPEGLYNQSQIPSIAATSHAALFDGTVKKVLMTRFANFEDYALKLHADKSETHPIIANSINDLEMLETMLKNAQKK